MYLCVVLSTLHLFVQATTVSGSHKEIDNNEALSSSLKSAEAPYPQQDEGAALVSLSSSAETDDLDKKEQRRAAGGDSSSTSSSGLSSADSTRCSTRGSDVASQPDDDEEEIFEDANSFPLDGIYVCVRVYACTCVHTCMHACVGVHTNAYSMLRVM